MILAPKVKKDSYILTDFQYNVLKMIIDYFRLHIPNKQGVYLSTIDFDNIEFRWSIDYLIKNSGEVLGSWSPMYPNNVFLKATYYNDQVNAHIADLCMKNSLKEQEVNNFLNFQQYKSRPHKALKLKDFQIQDIYKDRKKMDYITYIFEYGLGSPIYTALHELYHKYQYSANKYMPIIYYANSFISLLFGYNLASKCKFSIQGDVRAKLETEEMQKLIINFQQICTFIQTSIYTLSYTEQDEPYYNNQLLNYKNQFKSLKIEFGLILKIAKKYDILNDKYYDFLKQNFT